jgi:hypothetical protein
MLVARKYWMLEFFCYLTVHFVICSQNDQQMHPNFYFLGFYSYMSSSVSLCVHSKLLVYLLTSVAGKIRTINGSGLLSTAQMCGDLLGNAA